MPLTFPDPCYVVLHGHDSGRVALLDYEPPSEVWCAHPNAEPFDDPQLAINRAIELGVAPEDTRVFWPEGKHLDPQHQLVDDPDYVASDEPAPVPPEPIEVRLEKLEKRLGALEAR